jgi:hypothetical protein
MQLYFGPHAIEIANNRASKWLLMATMPSDAAPSAAHEIRSPAIALARNIQSFP